MAGSHAPLEEIRRCGVGVPGFAAVIGKDDPAVMVGLPVEQGILPIILRFHGHIQPPADVQQAGGLDAGRFGPRAVFRRIHGHGVHQVDRPVVGVGELIQMDHLVPAPGRVLAHFPHVQRAALVVARGGVDAVVRAPGERPHVAFAAVVAEAVEFHPGDIFARGIGGDGFGIGDVIAAFAAKANGGNELRMGIHKFLLLNAIAGAKKLWYNAR